ncbi:MAG TPA: hypothetical protein VEZ88_12840 [Steroidobacteraceae bacterium]|nr:hypothetical protein [Steroidobacteraceae bacterium]
MTTRTRSAFLAAIALTAAPLADADPVEPAFAACAQAFVQSFTTTYGPVTKVRIVPPAAGRSARERDPVTAAYSDYMRYTFFATDPKTGAVLASAACTARLSGRSVTLARLAIPKTGDKPLLLSARETP